MELTQKEIQILEEQVSPVVAQAESYEIDSVQVVESASFFLQKIRDTEKIIESKRTEFTKPLNQSLKAINSTFKKLSEPLVQARKLVTDKILSWRRTEQEKIAKEEERRRNIQEAHREAGHTVSEPIVLDRPEAKIGSSQVRKVWKFKVVDFAKVSDKYKLINSIGINEAIRAGHRYIDGLEIFQEEQLATTRR